MKTHAKLIVKISFGDLLWNEMRENRIIDEKTIL